MMKNIQIRTITTGDHTTIKQLIKDMRQEGAFIYNSMLELEGKEVAWVKNSLNKVKNKEASYIFAFDSDKPIGMARLEKRGGKHNHLADFGIRINKEYRGKGIGQEFLKFIFREAKKIGIKKITLDTYDTNLAARALYKKMGFKEYGFLPKSVKMGNRYLNEVFLYKDIK